jgi:hypothetical protein
MPTSKKIAPTAEIENTTAAASRINPEIDAKIDRFMADNSSYVEYLEGLSKEMLIRKVCLARTREIEAQKQYNRKVLAWLDKPENTEIKEFLVSAIPQSMKAEKQEQMLATNAKVYIKNKGLKI